MVCTWSRLLPQHLVVDRRKRFIVCRRCIFRFELAAGFASHLLHFARGSPGPVDFSCEIIRVTRAEGQSCPAIIDQLADGSEGGGNQRQRACERFDERQRKTLSLASHKNSIRSTRDFGFPP